MDEIKVSSKKLNYAISLKCNDRLELSKKVVILYNTHLFLNGKECLQDRHINLLAYYLVYGFNKKSMENYASSYNHKSGYIQTLNADLMKYGLMAKDTGNMRRRILSPRMEELSRYVKTKLPDDYERTFSFIFGEKF